LKELEKSLNFILLLWAELLQIAWV